MVVVISLIAFSFVGILLQRINAFPIAPTNEVGLFQAPHVFLTVNAEARVEQGQLQNRLVEVNWYNLDLNTTSWIGLFKDDPTIDGTTPILRIRPTTGEGQVTTRERFEVIDFHTAQIPNHHCMVYWVALFDGTTDTLITSNCLRIYPKWMREMRGVIGDKRLRALMIPGTHNSGSWDKYDGAQDDFNVVLIHARNQEDDIYSQLIHGIRYFDLRVASYPDTTERFWINHDAFRMHPLQTLIDDVQRFVKEFNEIVILDIHQLPVGFSGPADPEHGRLTSFLEERLGDILYLKSRGRDPTLNEIWRTRRNVILTYPVQSPTIPEAVDYLWPNLYQDWPNANNLEEIEAYFEASLPVVGCKGEIVVSMAELTPTPADIAFKPGFGLRGHAQLVNRPITDWFRRDHWYSKANIVATDYYLGNNIIEMTIHLNLNNGTCPV